MQPVYILLEVLVGLQASASYSFTDSTISDLGDTSCLEVTSGEPCSPWHDGMNVGFVWFGCTLAIGAILLGSRRPAGRLFTASTILFVVSGLGSIGVGLTPVNEHPDLHTVVAYPVFAGMLGALMTLGLALLGPHPRCARATLTVAGLTAVGAGWFFLQVLVGGNSATGAFERLALWPGYVWVSVCAVTVWRRAAGGAQPSTS